MRNLLTIRSWAGLNQRFTKQMCTYRRLFLFVSLFFAISISVEHSDAQHSPEIAFVLEENLSEENYNYSQAQPALKTAQVEKTHSASVDAVYADRIETSNERIKGTTESYKQVPVTSPDQGAAYDTPRLSPKSITELIKRDSHYESIDQFGNRVILTLDVRLQDIADGLLKKNRVPWGAIVAIKPDTGKILALASHSEEDPTSSPIALRASFPAASLFKVITASAAIEKAGMRGEDEVSFRGGNYTLGKGNYLPDPKKDRRQMTLGDAMGKSVNPVFGRIAVNRLNNQTLEDYARRFGFNYSLPCDLLVELSTYNSPVNTFEFARTAAGFGPVNISPLHAAVIAQTIAKKGLMMKPQIVERVIDKNGNILAEPQPLVLRRSISEPTSFELLEIMQSTVEDGTARKHFQKSSSAKLRNMQIAGKTGTLSGKDPKGLYHWFIGILPVPSPDLAIASLVIDNGKARMNGTAIARRFLEYYVDGGDIRDEPIAPEVRPKQVKSKKSKKMNSAVSKPSKSKSSSKTRFRRS